MRATPNGDPMPVWTIYDWPPFLARKWLVWDRLFTPTREMLAASTLIELRAMLPPDLTRVEREPGDDPKIVETWL